MEKIIMSRSMYKGIPILRWGEVKLVRLGKGTFVTIKPVKKNVRSLSQAKEVSRDFSGKYGCQTTITYDTEWKELCTFLKANYVTKEFIELNNLQNYEALLLNSETDGETHVLAAGAGSTSISELFSGFISGDDSDGEPQPKKAVFLTLRFDPNSIVIE